MDGTAIENGSVLRLHGKGRGPYFFIVSIMSNTYTARNANILIGVHVSPGLLEEMMEHYDEIMMRSHLNICVLG